MLRRITLAATAVTAALGLAAGPADAIYRDYEPLDEAPVVERIIQQDDKPPVDANGNRSCKTFAGGGYYWSPHGTVVTVTMTDDNGKKYTEKLRCEDGSWNTVVNFGIPTDGGYIYEAEAAYADVSGELQVVGAAELAAYSVAAP